MALQLKSKDSVKASAENVETKVVQADAMASAPVVKDENLGSKSDKLAFVAALGDPSQDDVTYITTPDGKKDKKVDPIIVGYRMKALEDIEVPDVAPGDDFTNNLMSFTPADVDKTRHVKAGEEFDITRFELGMLISRPEYNGKATGGQIPVTCAYATQSKNSSAGVAVKAATTTLPSVSLRAVQGSIKDVAIIPVLEFTTTQDPNTKATRKKRTILPGFEKFQPLCKDFVTTGIRRSGSTSKSGVETRNKNAEAFLKIAMAKKAN